jgi:hypothetical protein
MNHEGKSDSLQGKDIPSTGVKPEVKSVSVKKLQSFVGEQPLPAIEIAPGVLRSQSRRDFHPSSRCAYSRVPSCANPGGTQPHRLNRRCAKQVPSRREV